MQCGATMKQIIFCVFFLVMTTVITLAEIVGMQAPRIATEAEMKSSLNGIRIIDERGIPLDLNSVRHNGKRTLVTLWAHWCVNCRAEISGFKAIAQKCPDKWNIIFVSARASDYSKDTVKFEKFSLPWKIYHVDEASYSDPNKLRSMQAFYGATKDQSVLTPLHYLLSPKGQVQAIVNAKMSFEQPEKLAAFCAD